MTIKFIVIVFWPIIPFADHLLLFCILFCTIARIVCEKNVFLNFRPSCNILPFIHAFASSVKMKHTSKQVLRNVDACATDDHVT